MNDNKLKLISLLEKLENKLRFSNKKETADFFSNLRVNLSKTNELDIKILKQLCSSGAMVQYVGFSYQEEKLFGEIFDVSSQLMALSRPFVLPSADVDEKK